MGIKFKLKTLGKFTLIIFLVLSMLAGAFAVGTAPDSADSVAYWKFEDLTDETANIYDLTNTGSATSTTGKIDNAYEFTTATKYLSDTIPTSNAFTFCAWIYPTSVANTRSIFGHEVTNNEVSFRFSNNKLILPMYWNGKYQTQTFGSSTILTDTWQHVCMSYDTTEDITKIYYNGEVDATNTTTLDNRGTSNLNFRVGIFLVNTAYQFLGKIDEVAIFNTQLTDDEVAYLYQSGSPTSDQQYPFSTPASPEILTVTASTYNTTYQIQDFNVTLPFNSTVYETSNGSISINITEAGGNSSILQNFTISSASNGHYINQEKLNYNTTEEYFFTYGFYEISAKDITTNLSITDFNATYTNGTNNFTRSSGSNSSLYMFIEPDTYNISISKLGYITGYTNPTISDNYSVEQVSLYADKSIFINIYNSTSSTLTTQTITVNLELNGSLYSSNTTSDGTIFFSGLDVGEYTIIFTGSGFEETSYTVTVGLNTYQTLNAYLTESGDNNVIFTLLDFETGAILEGVTFNTETKINGTYTLTGSRLTDISGRTRVAYSDNVAYRFTASKTGYATKTFVLDPILFNSYNIKLQRDITNPDVADFAKVSIVINPSEYFNNVVNNFTMQVSSPTGNLIAYTYILTHSNGTTLGSDSGTNAYGEIFAQNVSIVNSTTTENIYLNYTYQLDTGEVKAFTKIYTFTDAGPDSGSIKASTGKYGLSLFDRVLIAIVIILIIAGMATFVGGIPAGALFTLLLIGYFAYTGFLETWIVILSVILLTITLTRFTQ